VIITRCVFTYCFCALGPTPIPPYFGGVPVGPDRPCWGSARISLKLISREIIFEKDKHGTASELLK